MRTSVCQFELLVDFMERNGDLNKPADGPHGRLTNIKKWKELCKALNTDPTGQPKNVEKWKKVWSDFKNNIKRKDAKIHRAASAAGGGPTAKLSLTDLEQRVLSIMGPQSATGLPGITEIGVEFPEQPAAPLLEGSPLNIHAGDLEHGYEVTVTEDLLMPGMSGSSPPSNLPEVVIGGTPTRHYAQTVAPGAGLRRGVRRDASTPQLPTPTRRRRVLHSPAPRRMDVSEHFLASDRSWQTLATEFVAENKKLRERELQLESQRQEENVRLRESELQMQGEWQILFARFLDIMERFSFSK